MPFVALLLAAATPVAAAPVTADNARLTALFDADQADRQPGKDPTKAMIADDARRAEVARLLQAGAVRTGLDYWHAAVVFQHGDGPRDYLLAHTLAITAVSKGAPDAAWIAAATLDRYLGAVGQPQVYGTQYRYRPGRAVTQEPYDRTLLTDEQRRAAGVETLAGQVEKAARFERERATAAP